MFAKLYDIVLDVDFYLNPRFVRSVNPKKLAHSGEIVAGEVEVIYSNGEFSIVKGSLESVIGALISARQGRVD